MFDRARYEMHLRKRCSGFFFCSRGAKNRQIVRLRAAGREDNLIGMRPDCGSSRFPGATKRAFCLDPFAVDRGGVSECAGKVPLHRGKDARVNRHRRGVVKIDSSLRFFSRHCAILSWAGTFCKSAHFGYTRTLTFAKRLVCGYTPSHVFVAVRFTWRWSDYRTSLPLEHTT